MNMKEKADMIYSQNQEMMKELGVSKEAFRVCFEKGYNFEQDEREAKGEMSKNDKESPYSAMYDDLEGTHAEKCLFVISQDANGMCNCSFQGNLKIGIRAIYESCMREEDIRKMLTVSLALISFSDDTKKS
ncbi:hypothetical protein [Porphyromonas gingivicanis]|uniref:hypothetical protein n=1 Tax=Porphyromonas gingivicanis TaxID=266762 RepID=UPI00046F4DCC|nr:hypothetical protein [Porphyromonas gingivicanis]